MNGFTALVRIAASICIGVGLLHGLFGIGTARWLGADASGTTLVHALLDSQDRFYGASFIGYGALLLLYLRDRARYAPVLTIIAAAVCLGGLARLLSIAVVGAPPLPVMCLNALELVLPPLLLAWQRALPVAPTQYASPSSVR